MKILRLENGAKECIPTPEYNATEIKQQQQNTTELLWNFFFRADASMKSEKREKEERKSKNENTRLRR